MLLLCLTALADDTPAADPPEEPPAEEEPAEDPPAEDPPAEPPLRSFTLTPEGTLESALEGFEAGVEETDAMPEELTEELEEALGAAAMIDRLPAGLVSPRVRGRFFLRPTVTLGGLDASTAMRLGLAGGHRWWRLSDGTLALAGETRLDLDAPLAGARGSAASLTSLAGPWLGPVGLRLGPSLRYERADYGDAVLDPALTLGGRAVLSAELGPIRPYVGGGMEAVVAGSRPGDLEPIALVGLAGERGWVLLSARGMLQQTAQGTRWQAGLGLQITPHLPTGDE